MCPECEATEMRVVYFHLLQVTTEILYQCDTCKRIDVEIE